MPQIWKTAVDIPVPKKPIPLVDNDLRPVSLTPVLMKCFERLIKPKLQQHVKEYIDLHQFAYRENMCTEDAVITLQHKVTKHLDEKPFNYVRCLFIDFSSAFNTIQPHLLIHTLQEYGVPPALCLWLMSFLEDRRQRVVLKHETSNLRVSNTGAPQGCVLSQVLFLYTPTH